MRFDDITLFEESVKELLEIPDPWVFAHILGYPVLGVMDPPQGDRSVNAVSNTWQTPADFG